MDKIKFYDTNELLHNLEEIEGKIYLSSITLQELEHIKTSKNKDEDVRFEARKVTRFLRNNEDRYSCIAVGKLHYDILEDMKLPIDNDNLIIACAVQLANQGYDVEFVTDDICCYNIAKNIFGLKCSGIKTDIKLDKYKGYKEIIMTDEEMAVFYELEEKENKYDLLINEYLIIKNTLNQPVDAFRFDGLELVPLSVKSVQSSMFGKLKAKDFYQQIVLDSFFNNTITVVKGKAGSGKSYLAMNYLFSQLDKGKIDKIIMFINDTPVRNANLHGFLPGTLTEKLAESQVGNFLSGKLGDKMQMQRLVAMEKLVLLPISDIRGYETPPNSAVYITESQNMTVDMMKLAIQRIGDTSICIIDGDCDAQVDNRMFEGSNNGMRRLSEIFRGEDVYGEIELNTTYRSKLAQIAEKM